jgi:hypothetical protein
MMTAIAESLMPRRVGRKLMWPERISAKFAAGTLKRIADVLADREERLNFIREAVEREIDRRRRQGKRRKRQ